MFLTPRREVGEHVTERSPVSLVVFGMVWCQRHGFIFWYVIIAGGAIYALFRFIVQTDVSVYEVSAF